MLTKWKTLKRYAHWARKLWHPGKRCAYLIGTPIHDNIGDGAIAVAEKEFLLGNGFKRVVELTTADIWEYGKCIGRLLPRNAKVFLHGGGNMGDQYELEEVLRRKILLYMQKRPITVFPQTIHYSDTPKGRTMEAESVTLYGKCTRLTLIAREQTSYDLMTRLYPKAKVLLTPDIVLSMQPQVLPAVREGILLCFREDSEKLLTAQDRQAILQMAENTGELINTVDMIADKMLRPHIREAVVNAQLQKFSGAKLLITDRLHGMVFAAITGTPCVVFGNYNHKVRGTYEWIAYLPYIRFVNTVTEAQAQIAELLQFTHSQYDSLPLQRYFDRIREILK